MDVEKSSEGVVRVSFSWLLAGGTVIVVLGVLGGLLGAQLMPARAPLRAPESGQLLSTVQEVTISPSTAAAELVARGQRSVVLIGSAGPPVGGSGFAAGVAVTNDGLVVTADSLPDGDLVVFDYLGKPLAAEYIGRDALFGLSYLRIVDGVLLPLDLRGETAPVGFELIALGRSSTSLMPKLSPFRVLEHSLPAELSARGVRLLLRGPVTSDAELTGGAVLDDEGRLAGLLISPAAGLALPADQLRESIDRVVNGRREVNPFAELGLTIRYAFATLKPADGRRFVIEVTGVAPNTPAAAADFARGDFMVAVGEQAADWNQSAVALFSQPRPFPVTVWRSDREIVLTVPVVATQP
jgi:hypothetical protein